MIQFVYKIAVLDFGGIHFPRMTFLGFWAKIESFKSDITFKSTFSFTLSALLA